MDNGNLVFGSVCSGIEAASVAWESLGWKAAWFSEIEPFPCAVLTHHYPGVQNLGDMTTIAPRILAGDIHAPDIFCGGTPCQAFSVAGLRRSLDDARGNLTLTFCDIADAIDSARTVRGQHPAVIFWENVPGVLNTKDNAFGCFLGALSGEGCELQPAGGKWTNAGCVFGPQRTVAWRILDAQYFGVAQRRRRVFVVASARKGFDPTAVLFEFDGVRRDTAPSREARQVAPTIPARSTAGGGLGTDFDCDGGVITMAHGQGGAEIGFDRGPTLTCNHEAPIAAYPVGVTIHGTDPTVQKVTSYDELAQCLRARTPGNIDNSSTTVVQQPVAYGIRTANTSSNGWGIQEEVTHTLDCAQGLQGAGLHREISRDRVLQQARAASEAGDSGCSATEQERGGQSRLGQTPFAVRRLTVEECEFLQGFPRGYTAIPWRKKPASECPDSPRYKVLGNSWAVPVVRWIGSRILKELSNA